MKIGIIGFGHLAKSMVKGLLSKEDLSENIYITSKTNKTKEEALVNFDICSYPNNKELVENSDLIIMAVKPNAYIEVLGEIKDVLENKILISFLAGTAMENLEKELNENSKIIRVMPSIAMEVCQSLTAIYPNKNISESDLYIVKSLFDKLGTALITDEEDLERVSVVSGSALGYVAQIVDSMTIAAESIGYTKEVEKSVIQVFAGAIELLKTSNITAKEMAKAVATEGGTTIEGIKYMQSQNLDDIFSNAHKASYEKVKKMKN